MSARVVVVGGGLAGLSAALRLSDRGARVRLLERRSILGGRAYSYRAREAGHAVDNGQHLMMGCYHRTLAFLDRIGTARKVEIQPRLAVELADPRTGRATFACARLPAPLHLSIGALGYGNLTRPQRAWLLAGGLRFVARYLRGALGDATVAEALEDLGQGPRLRAAFWDPLAIAVLNELPGRASAKLFGEVLRRVFLAPAAASRLVFPRTGLSELFVDPAVAAIEARGGVVEPGVSVVAVACAGERASGVVLSNGGVVPAEAVILAVPPGTVAALVPEALRGETPFSGIGRLRGAPIVSVHLWFRERFAAPRMLGLLDGPIHWLFTPPMQPKTGRYLTLVTSGAYDLVEQSPERIEHTARESLARYLPRVAALRPADVLVTKERAATFAATPGEQADRPPVRTPLANLFLAGDWTDTGLPATIESAILSGERAAAAVQGGGTSGL